MGASAVRKREGRDSANASASGRAAAAKAGGRSARARTGAPSGKARAAEASRASLLDSAVHVVRAKGYSAARVDDICAEAGLTKGAFFHHFASKEDCAVAAAAHFAANADALFDAAPFTRLADPRERVLGYVDFRKASLKRELASSPASSARWCRRPTRPIPSFATPATASSGARGAARGRPGCGEGALCAAGAVEPEERRALFARRAAGRIHSRQGEPRAGGRGRLPRPSKAYFETLLPEAPAGQGRTS